MRGSVIQKHKGTGKWYVVFDLERTPAGKRKQKWHSGYATERRRAGPGRSARRGLRRQHSIPQVTIQQMPDVVLVLDRMDVPRVLRTLDIWL